MPISNQLSVEEKFFEPLQNLFLKSIKTRKCRVLDDQEWLKVGIQRVIGTYRSGRDYLQTLGFLGKRDFCRSHFFETLKSSRRLRMVQALCESLMDHVGEQLNDQLINYQEFLKDFEIYAGDGHYHEHAAHDPIPSEGKRRAVGHFFYTDLRKATLGYLSLEDLLGEHGKIKKCEHDMHMIKRLGADAFRINTPVRRKVLWVWDRAGIDFKTWYKWKHDKGIYFISRVKDNMKLETNGVLHFDLDAPVNQGVISDEYVATSQHVMMRRVIYKDLADDTIYEYLTSEFNLPPGIIALLYKMRWNIEKIFEETKVKCDEKKAWASSENAKQMQAHFICITHNLMRVYENHIKDKYQIENTAENKRREKRYVNKLQIYKARGFIHTGIYSMTAYATQINLKFIRWLRYALQNQNCEIKALDRLSLEYAHL